MKDELDDLQLQQRLANLERRRDLGMDIDPAVTRRLASKGKPKLRRRIRRYRRRATWAHKG
jgi:hypothetical protein